VKHCLNQTSKSIKIKKSNFKFDKNKKIKWKNKINSYNGAFIKFKVLFRTLNLINAQMEK
jgi:hypothetical protein